MPGLRVLARTRSLYGAEGPLIFAKSTSERGDWQAVSFKDLSVQTGKLPLPDGTDSVDSVTVALVGLTSAATRDVPGTSVRRISSRLAVNSAPTRLIPVRLPPGRPGKAGDKSEPDRVFGDKEDDRDLVVAALATKCGKLHQTTNS